MTQQHVIDVVELGRFERNRSILLRTTKQNGSTTIHYLMSYSLLVSLLTSIQPRPGKPQQRSCQWAPCQEHQLAKSARSHQCCKRVWQNHHWYGKDVNTCENPPQNYFANQSARFPTLHSPKAKHIFHCTRIRTDQLQKELSTSHWNEDVRLQREPCEGRRPASTNATHLCAATWLPVQACRLPCHRHSPCRLQLPTLDDAGFAAIQGSM